MAKPLEEIEYGTLASLVKNEPGVLIDSFTFSPTRTETLYQNLNGTTTRVKYTDPIVNIEFSGKIMSNAGLAIAHPGSKITSLANFTATMHGFDPNEGTIVFKDPSREYSEESDFITYSFSALHLPFVS